MSPSTSPTQESSIYDKHEQQISSKINDLRHILQTKFHITLNEFLFLSSFIFNFLLSRLIHYSSPQEEVYNYYNNKHNFFNTVFVKRGWGWTTFVLIVFYAVIIIPKLLARSNSSNTQREKRVEFLFKAVVRYVLVTFWWILFTQWCFGLPIMDKIFVLTGGVCTLEPNPATAQTTPPPTIANHQLGQHFIQDLETLVWKSNHVSSYHCRKFKGSWMGGYDPSGHVFLMIHSSIYLYFETAAWFNWDELSAFVRQLKQNIIEPRSLLVNRNQFLRGLAQVVLIGLVALWWFMLLMTNVYFHSIVEKLSGLAFGYFGVLVVYVLPRWFVN
ncbi:hypothetical protein CANMA_005117 [Candida margitis]|uniref:uncharacterized protein n=1 Tax=Candida margitis TaxID=1775924 RepID=UPI0022265387|nr:uncharacterized protein CANMA_005117 [Candida margitis]KAI5952038.1 hypothetical protein CANMA_005117 [Candida margitis]